LPQVDILTQVPTLLAYLQTIPAQQLSVEAFCALLVVPLIYVVLHVDPSALHDVLAQSAGQFVAVSPLAVSQTKLPQIEATAQVPLWHLQSALPMPSHIHFVFTLELCATHQVLLKHLWQVPLSLTQSLSTEHIVGAQSAGQFLTVSLDSQVPLPQTGMAVLVQVYSIVPEHAAVPVPAVLVFIGVAQGAVTAVLVDPAQH
jgi:hypothetical protein